MRQGSESNIGSIGHSREGGDDRKQSWIAQNLASRFRDAQEWTEAGRLQLAGWVVRWASVILPIPDAWTVKYAEMVMRDREIMKAGRWKKLYFLILSKLAEKRKA